MEFLPEMPPGANEAEGIFAAPPTYENETKLRLPSSIGTHARCHSDPKQYNEKNKRHRKFFKLTNLFISMKWIKKHFVFKNSTIVCRKQFSHSFKNYTSSEDYTRKTIFQQLSSY